jgi:Tfp pilus assembly pilus retraction ATPase PilT
MAWIDQLFKMMLEKKASDLHMTSEHVPKIRASGDMVDLPGLPKLCLLYTSDAADDM